jgi:Malectin domain
MKNTLLAPILVIWTITCFHTTNQLEIVYAVNCGGNGHTDSNGINYQKDPSTEGAPHTWATTITGISDHDRVLYQTARYKNPSVSYDLPLTGNGWYGLLLHFADDSSAAGHKRRLKVTLNGQHILLEDLNLYAECGQSNACNQIFYFKVCNGALHYVGHTSTLWNVEKVNVNVKMHTINAIINGILLVKGEPGEGLSVVGSKTVFYFDPKHKRQCNGSPPTESIEPIENETNEKCSGNSPVWVVLNVYGSTKQTFRIVPENNSEQ